MRDPGSWLEPERILICGNPASRAALRELGERRIALLVDLRLRAHGPRRFARFGLAEVHVPTRDKCAPSAVQIDAALAAIAAVVDGGRAVAIHCRNGRGRSGVLAACWLVQRRGYDAERAITAVRAVRPGAIETAEQSAAIRSYATRVR